MSSLKERLTPSSPLLENLGKALADTLEVCSNGGTQFRSVLCQYVESVVLLGKDILQIFFVISVLRKKTGGFKKENGRRFLQCKLTEFLNNFNQGGRR